MGLLKFIIIKDEIREIPKVQNSKESSSDKNKNSILQLQQKIQEKTKHSQEILQKVSLPSQPVPKTKENVTMKIIMDDLGRILDEKGNVIQTKVNKYF